MTRAPRGSTDTLDYRCRCGALRATVSLEARDRPRRVICHCRDCQAFQHALGSVERVLDAHGGTDIAMVSPASLAFVAGREHLAALSLYPKGLLRWHAGCCDTPLGNTPAAYRFPHLGLTTAILAETNGAGAVEAALGPAREHIFAAEATNGMPPGVRAKKVPLSLIPPVLAALAGRVARGEYRRSPFFDAEGVPIVAPRVLAAAERAALAPYASA